MFAGAGGGGAKACVVGTALELLACLSKPFTTLLSYVELRSRWTLENEASRDEVGRGGESGNISSMPVPWKSNSLFRRPALGGQSGNLRGHAL